MTCSAGQLTSFRKVIRFEDKTIYSTVEGGSQTGTLNARREILPEGSHGYVSHFRTVVEPADSLVTNTTAGLTPYLYEGDPAHAVGKGRISSDAAGGTAPTQDGATDYTTKDLGQDARHFVDGLQGLLTGEYTVTGLTTLAVTMIVSGMAVVPCGCGCGE